MIKKEDNEEEIANDNSSEFTWDDVVEIDIVIFCMLNAYQPK